MAVKIVFGIFSHLNEHLGTRKYDDAIKNRIVKQGKILKKIDGECGMQEPEA